MTRGWERFLSARDKEHLAQGFADREPYGLGDRPVVVVVDAYYASVGDKREPLLESIKSWPLSCGLEGWAAIDRTAELLAGARAAGVPVVYLRDLPFPGSWAPPGRPMIAELTSTDMHRAKGNEIVAEIAPRFGDVVIEKAAPSGFAGTPLLYHLNHLRADSLIICGEATSGCVRATVVDAATNRFRVTVVEDCCYDRTEAAHWINLFDMAMKYADVVVLNEVMETLGTR
ncbi:cysteine hydrolase family protein [Actinophytocola sp.]|uniref:cysteine hydrolase family protein n=1 Tax=Actinophytocola sp. TaxID=1872138 RepID=UPI003D6A83A5